MARRERRRATWGALAASLLVHLVILVLLAREVAPGFRMPPAQEGDFQVALVRRELPPLASRQRSANAPSGRAQRLAPSPIIPHVPLPRPRSESPLRPSPPRSAPAVRPLPIPAPPAPVRQTPPVNGAPASGGASAGAPASGAGGRARWSVQGEDEGDEGVRKVLRATVGCSHEDFAQLRPDERAECDRRTGKEARLFNGSGDMTDPQKRAAFIAASQAQERARAARTGPMQDVNTPCKGMSNMSVGCLNLPSKHGNGGDEP